MNDEKARVRAPRYCEPCEKEGYWVFARVYDVESGQHVCGRCHGDLLKAREEACES